MTEQNTRALTEEELDLLPYDATDPFVQLPEPPNDRPITFCTWNGHLIFTYFLVRRGPWCFDSTDLEVTPHDWEKYYPKILLLKDVVAIKNLTGYYDGKRVRWSGSNQRWQYFNHTPVQFSETQPPDQEELEVSQVLDTIASTLERTTDKLTPEQTHLALEQIPETPPVPTPAAASSSVPNPTPLPALFKGKAPELKPK